MINKNNILPCIVSVVLIAGQAVASATDPRALVAAFLEDDGYSSIEESVFYDAEGLSRLMPPPRHWRYATPPEGLLTPVERALRSVDAVDGPMTRGVVCARYGVTMLTGPGETLARPFMAVEIARVTEDGAGSALWRFVFVEAQGVRAAPIGQARRALGSDAAAAQRCLGAPMTAPASSSAVSSAALSALSAAQTRDAVAVTQSGPIALYDDFAPMEDAQAARLLLGLLTQEARVDPDGAFSADRAESPSADGFLKPRAEIRLERAGAGILRGEARDSQAGDGAAPAARLRWTAQVLTLWDGSVRNAP